MVAGVGTRKGKDIDEPRFGRAVIRGDDGLATLYRETARWQEPAGRGLATNSREGGLSSPMLLPILRAVAQLIFELLLRPMIVDHVVDPAGAGRVGVAAEHVLIRGLHDRLGLLSCHLAGGGIR